MNASQAGRGELGAGSLQLLQVEALLTVFTMLGGGGGGEGETDTPGMGERHYSVDKLNALGQRAELFHRQPRPPECGNQLTFLQQSGARWDRTRM